MNNELSVNSRQATATVMAKTADRISVRLLLRCPQCKQNSLSIGKSTGDFHSCPSCGVRFAIK
ncbi:MAG: hypothetical protein MSG64_04140 [Pyrinomonadaceae bacterium MAG19_C2-C3]|nr:hypothetical protein [Pyrinomonadaceae bacterium MAG19_C2-C3]